MFRKKDAFSFSLKKVLSYSDFLTILSEPIFLHIVLKKKRKISSFPTEPFPGAVTHLLQTGLMLQTQKSLQWLFTFRLCTF